jgi:CelD/BcsL family acetyltransferase involved in cellulose biosynthesis
MQQLKVSRFEDPTHLPHWALQFWREQTLDHPMRSPDWLLGWWKVYCHNASKCGCVYVVHDNDRPIAIALFYIRTLFPGIRCLRLIGDYGACSDHSSLIVASGYQDVVLPKIAQELLRDAAGVWDTLCFETVDLDDQNLLLLVREMQRLKFEFSSHNTTDCWIAELAPTREAFLMSLSKNHRKRCRQWQREYFDSGRAHIVEADETNWQSAWSRLVALNRLRRWRLGDRSAFDDAQFLDFHQAYIARGIGQSRIALRELYVDCQHVASEYVLFGNDTLFCYQSGMVTNDSRVGYGNLSVLGLINDAIDRGLSRIDFLRGDEPYKRHWNAVRSDCVTWRLSSGSFSGKMYRGFCAALDIVREKRSGIGQSNPPILTTAGN